MLDSVEAQKESALLGCSFEVWQDWTLRRDDLGH